MRDTGDDVLLLLFARARSSLGHLFGYLFLSCNGARRPFAGARIGVRALTTDWKPAAVPKTPVAAEIHQALYVHRDFAAEIAFNHIFAVDGLADLNDLIFRQIAD